MTAWPDGETRLDDPAHDFPRRIIYRRLYARALVVRLDGGEGTEQVVELRMRSAPCADPASP